MSQLIDNVNNTNQSQQKRLRQFFGYRTTKSVLDDIGGIVLGARQKTNEKRAYAVLAQQYNAEILEGRRIKKIERDKIKSEKAKKRRLEQKKQKIKNDTIVVTSGDDVFQRFYNALKPRYQPFRTINVVKEGGQGGEFALDFTYKFVSGDMRSYSDEFQEIFLTFLQIDSDTDRLQHDEEPYTLYINIGEELSGETIIQAFKDGVTNCFFTPIITWCEDKLSNAKSKSSIEKYRAMVNKLKKDELKYRNKGVNKEDMSFLSNRYQINIEVNTPFQKEFIKVKSNKKALTTFRFINTRINHLEHNEVVNLAPTLISQKKMNELKEQLMENNTYHTYTRNMSGCSSISTLDATYKLDNFYIEIINEFEKDTGIIECYIDDFKDTEVSRFVRQGVHFNECVDFKRTQEVEYDPTDDTYDELMAMSLEDREINSYHHIDMRKAYSAFKQCKYYKGFLGKITDYRPTNKIEGIGYYRIQKVNFDNATPIMKAYNDVMKIYNDNVYPSPELDFLKDNNVEFEIIEGCWGSDLDFEFTEQMKNEKYDGVPIYSRYTGCMNYYGQYKNFYMYCDKQLAQHIVKVSDYDTATYIDRTDELQVSYKKQHNNHLSHICGFITSYMRLNVLEQLMTINVDNVVRVCVDGIYYDGDEVECVNVFRKEPKPIKSNHAGDTYISNYECNIPFCESIRKEHNLKELHAGVGGSGKTHKNIYDKGLIRKLFVAPSWKLSKAKNQECGIDNQVWANICSKDPEKISFIRKNYNVLIIDEVSMMSNESKQSIFDYYFDMKIIMCGDVGYQLPQFNDESEDFKEEGFDKIIRYTINRRCKCEKLQLILDLCREEINNEFLFTMIKKAIKQRITKEELKMKYCKKDMILCRSNKKKDEYTEMFKHIDKFYIIKTDKQYSNGEIVYERPDPQYYKEDVDYEIRHAYTIHSIQGETSDYNLYLDKKFMEPQAIYTALSRAKYLSQIFIIN